MQSSIADSYQRENHRHLNCNSDDAQDCTNRSMCEIGENQLIEQFLIIRDILHTEMGQRRVSDTAQSKIYLLLNKERKPLVE